MKTICPQPSSQVAELTLLFVRSLACFRPLVRLPHSICALQGDHRDVLPELPTEGHQLKLSKS